MARLYLDEMLGGYAGELIGLGHDVMSATEPSRRGKTDAWHFRAATEADRVLLTWNWRDFAYIHDLWTTLRTLGVVEARHSGILTAKGSASARSDWIQVVHEKLVGDSEIRGRMFSWIASRREWDEAKTRPEQD